MIAADILAFFRSTEILPPQESTGLSTESVDRFRRHKPEYERLTELPTGG